MNSNLLVAALVAALLQHVVHEYSHALMAGFTGVRVRKIQWFTYARPLGTRVWFEDEPTVEQGSIDPKWGWIAVAGAAGTALFGYLCLAVYLVGFPNLTGRMAAVLFYGSLFGLTLDPLYLIFGALFRFGDAVGVMKACQLRLPTLVLISLTAVALGCLALNGVWFPGEWVWRQ